MSRSRQISPPPAPDQRLAVAYAQDSRIFTALVLHRLRTEWLLWLAFTTELDPYSTDRSEAMRTADALLSEVLRVQLGGDT